MPLATLFVVAPARSPSLGEDTRRACLWTCQDRPAICRIAEGGILSPLVCISQALDAGELFDQVVVLRDELLITGLGLDAWVRERLVQGAAGLLGVLDGRLYDQGTYARYAGLFAEWGAPVAAWRGGRPVLHDAFLAMPRRLVERLFTQQWLIPAGADRWDLPLGVYLSWLAAMSGWYVVGWGSTQRQIPPLYITETPQDPGPHLLLPEFSVYWPLTRVRGYAEGELRMWYQQQRGEIVPEWSPTRPLAIGRGFQEAPIDG